MEPEGSAARANLQAQRSLVEPCLMWDPSSRPTALDLLLHPTLLEVPSLRLLSAYAIDADKSALRSPTILYYVQCKQTRTDTYSLYGKREYCTTVYLSGHDLSGPDLISSDRFTATVQSSLMHSTHFASDGFPIGLVFCSYTALLQYIPYSSTTPTILVLTPNSSSIYVYNVYYRLHVRVYCLSDTVKLFVRVICTGLLSRLLRCPLICNRSMTALHCCTSRATSSDRSVARGDRRGRAVHSRPECRVRVDRAPAGRRTGHLQVTDCNTTPLTSSFHCTLALHRTRTILLPYSIRTVDRRRLRTIS